jgi:hypothetical protein
VDDAADKVLMIEGFDAAAVRDAVESLRLAAPANYCVLQHVMTAILPP